MMPKDIKYLHFTWDEADEIIREYFLLQNPDHAERDIHVSTEQNFLGVWSYKSKEDEDPEKFDLTWEYVEEAYNSYFMEKYLDRCAVLYDFVDFDGPKIHYRVRRTSKSEKSRRNRELLALHRTKRYTLKKLGEKFGVNPERVRQIILRQERQEKRLQESRK